MGKNNILKVLKKLHNGYTLIDEENTQEVFLPENFAPLKVDVGSKVKAFVYPDTQGELVATTELPLAVVGEYALLDAIEIQEFGAFFDWGTSKDLLVPGNEQKIKVRKFESHIVRVCKEDGTGRIFGTTKLGKYIESSDFDISIGDEVDVYLAKESELGFRVIVNKKFIGMIYKNEIFQRVSCGKYYKAFVKKLREDGLVDVALQEQGVKNLVDSKDIIIDFLERNGGSSFLNDKSSPEDIKNFLNMSKKTFKRAIGMLYKDKMITISDSGIKLNQ
ncbi:S1 domain protein [Bacteriovorax sp. BAL6_X]|uniref:CvfB family protein n=1 Tax=Bacteriovorax sp. BAL6_X TaxID=1201290 RepID=UPI000386BC53|nr:S1-like domain-containing RNA-binding protein [Bacteriovorax sp. BAL6_X]EPZ49777.1 S1 domain protein [Bacteriovorax sp. BAL6_X]